MVDYTFTLKTFELFILILVRIASFVYIAPFFGMANTPGRVKVGLSFFVSLIIFSTINMNEVTYTGTIEYAIIVVKEVITGITIGFAAYICTTIVLFAGNIMDMEMGLSMATLFDPTTRIQSTITGNLYNYFVMMLLIVSNMHLYILRAVVDSYQLIPVSGQNFEWDHLMASMVQYMTDSMVIGFRIVLPVFVCTMILNCILGIMAKVSPQMNMFSIGMQLKILVGFVVLYLVVDLLPSVSNIIFIEIKTMVVDMIKGMY